MRYGWLGEGMTTLTLAFTMQETGSMGTRFLRCRQQAGSTAVLLGGA